MTELGDAKAELFQGSFTIIYYNPAGEIVGSTSNTDGGEVSFSALNVTHWEFILDHGVEAVDVRFYLNLDGTTDVTTINFLPEPGRRYMPSVSV